MKATNLIIFKQKRKIYDRKINYHNINSCFLIDCVFTKIKYTKAFCIFKRKKLVNFNINFHFCSLKYVRTYASIYKKM